MKRTVVAALLASVPFFATGCSNLEASQLVPSEFVSSTQHPKSVRVEAEGSPRKMKLGARDISTEEMDHALREAVLTSGVFERVIDDGRADYVLSVKVVSIDRPEPGLEMTAESSLRWSLRDMADGATVWQRTIDTKYEANPREADFMDEREDVAIAGAIRKNLTRGLEHIAELQLE